MFQLSGFHCRFSASGLRVSGFLWMMGCEVVLRDEVTQSAPKNSPQTYSLNHKPHTKKPKAQTLEPKP